MTHSMQAGDLCLVTGVSGYLGSWVAKDLLARGFKVRGTVRTLADIDRSRVLGDLLPGVELVAADLRARQGWPEAVRDCAWVFHVASPQAVASEANRTSGAVDGTRYLMSAALAEPTVRKIVLTSSEAAIAYGYPRSRQRFTEDDWTRLDGAAGKNDYFRSKTLAERLAWDMAGDPERNPRGVALSVINPSFIAGPSLVPWGRFSLESIRSLAEGKMPVVPDMVSHMVDVRDCAAMHIALMNNPATDGHRHFSFGATATMRRIAQVIDERYGDQGFKTGVRTIPTWVLALFLPFSSQVGSLYGKLSQPNVYETKWPDACRYRHTSFDEIVCASMDSMLEHGWLTPKRRAA